MTSNVLLFIGWEIELKVKLVDGISSDLKSASGGDSEVLLFYRTFLATACQLCERLVNYVFVKNQQQQQQGNK